VNGVLQLVAQVGVFARFSGCLGGQACVKFHTLVADILAFLFVVSVGIACAFAAAGAWLVWAQRVAGRDGAVTRPRAARQQQRISDSYAG
jgi:hypothetical protein